MKKQPIIITAFMLCSLLTLAGCGQRVDITMVTIPGGTYWMGCAEDDTGCLDNEQPRHQVTVSTFQMSETEVTRGQWKAVMGDDPSEFDACNDCPVDNVAWEDARKFALRMRLLKGKKYRLPTEAEWEYAARAGSQGKYGGCGNDPDCLYTMAWFIQNSDEHTQPAKEKDPNDFGLYGMYGNVAEWCQDYYDKDYYTISPAVDPKGPALGTMHVYRGGTWGSFHEGRDWFPSYRKRDGAWANDRGFRLCLDIDQ